MGVKKLIKDFYKSDALINSTVLEQYLHPEVQIEWHSTKGLLHLGYAEIVSLAAEMGRAYVRSKVRITHILCDRPLVSVRYSHFIKTIENPREEMLLGHFMVIWEVKDQKLYRGFQMSQAS